MVRRFAYTLHSQDDAPAPFGNADNSNSTPYSYLENIIWPELSAIQPYSSVRQHIFPFFQTSDPVSCIPESSNPSVNVDTFGIFDDLHHFIDDLNNTFNCNYCDYLSSYPFEDGIINEVDSLLDLGFMEPAESSNQQPEAYPTVSTRGTVSVFLRHSIRVDVLPNRAIYLTNSVAACIAAVNGVGDKSCVIHLNGRVHHIGPIIHMVTLHRKAKIDNRGIAFSSTRNHLSYFVDDSGTKPRSERFRHLDYDFSAAVFYSDSLRKDFQKCQKMVDEAIYKSYLNGVETWKIGGVCIMQDARGDVSITRNEDFCAIRTSPNTGQVSVKTLSAEINIGYNQYKYFDVRKEDKRVTADPMYFKVRNGSQMAGFNSSCKVVLF